MRAAYSTPVFAPGDPLVCHSIQLRPSLWAVLFNELQQLGEKWSWRQDDPGAATVAEVIAEIREATDQAVFAGCIMIGEVKWITTAVPEWALLCDGTVYDKEDYPELAAVIDSAYEVDPLTFRVPDLLFRFPRGAVVPGTEGGETSYTISVAQMPAHAHGLHSHSSHDHTVSPDLEGAGVPDLAAGPAFPSSTGSASVDSTGGGDAIDIEPPYHDLVPVIVAKYPGA